MYKQSAKLTFVLRSFGGATLNPPKSVDVSALTSDDMTNLDRDWPLLPVRRKVGVQVTLLLGR